VIPRGARYVATAQQRQIQQGLPWSEGIGESSSPHTPDAPTGVQFELSGSFLESRGGKLLASAEGSRADEDEPMRADEADEDEPMRTADESR